MSKHQVLKKIVQKPYQAIAACFDSLELFSLRDPIIPPKRYLKPNERRKNHFLRSGEQIIKFLSKRCGLSPTSRVLDVGYRYGRVAIPLTKFLNQDGSYEGIDIHSEGYKWCHNQITPRHPNFRFQLMDVKNDFYHPDGKELASELKFPFEDRSFDFVFLFSVFTHMLPDDLKNYFSEVARVLKVGGQSVITYSLISPETERLAKEGKLKQSFEHPFGVYSAQYSYCHEKSLAYQENWIVEMYQKNNMQIQNKIYYGRWRGNEKSMQSQDVIIAKKMGK